MNVQTCEKDDSVRVAGIQKTTPKSPLEFVAEQGKEAAMNTGAGLFVIEIMLQADDGTYFRSLPLRCCINHAVARGSGALEVLIILHDTLTSREFC